MNNINDVIINEIKRDRERLLKQISDIFLYDFDDISEETEIILSNDWNTIYKKTES